MRLDVGVWDEVLVARLSSYMNRNGSIFCEMQSLPEADATESFEVQKQSTIMEASFLCESRCAEPMSEKPSKQKDADSASRFAPLDGYFVLGGLFLIACMGRYIDTYPEKISSIATYAGILSTVLFLFLMLLLAVTSTILIVIHEGESTQQKRKESGREHRRRLKRKTEAANFAAQLKKKDFEIRLRSFTNHNVDNVEENPESQMEFWEREQEYSRTPSRPVELIRYLLQRVSKLVGQG